MAEVLGVFRGKTQNILLVSRNPEKWIKSIFIQKIKQGYYGSYGDFLLQQEKVILETLNFRRIVDLYSKRFRNILILPYELFQEDEDGFWRIVSDRFKVPYMSSRYEGVLNSSFEKADTYTLAKLNELNALIELGLSGSDGYGNQREKDRYLSILRNSSKWIYRRFIEHSEKSYRNQVNEIVGATDEMDEFFCGKLPHSMKESIRDNYCVYLRRYLDHDLITRYIKSIESKNIY